MGLTMFAAAGALAASAAPSDAAQIRALRAQSNAAIAAHDYAALRRFFTSDYTILPGSSGRPFSADDMAKRIAGDFTDPTFVTYVRTPQRIVISDRRLRAAESGRWVGIWRKPDGTMRISGVYQATWNPTPAGWRLKNESFVTLTCTGSKECTGD